MENPFWQIGVVVPDLKRARDEWSAAFGLEFSDIFHFQTHVRVGDEIEPRTTSACLTKGNLPCIELVQAGEFPWEPATAGIHHVAIWSDDPEKYIADTVAAGGRVLARSADQAGDPPGFVYVQLASGARIEVLDARRKAEFQELLGPDILV